MMFVDESGDPGYPGQRSNWKKWGGSKLFVRVGVIIHGWKWKVWHLKLNRFKKNRGLNWDAEIKAAQIRRGEGDFIGWKEEERKAFLFDLLHLIGSNLDMTLIGVAIDKMQVNVTKKERLVRPEVRSLELLLERYNFFLDRQQDKSGIVILDPTLEQKDDNLRYFQRYLQQYSINLKPLRIVEGTFFAKSHTSNMLQIADVCANVFYRFENRSGQPGQRRNEFDSIYPRFWRHNRQVKGYGIKRWP